MYYTYILRCEDGSLYTGITNNLERRMKEHFNKEERCAKYTYFHNAKKLEAVWKMKDRALSSKLEYYIKRLTKKQKEDLIRDNKNFEKLLAEKIDCLEYERMYK